MNRVPVDFRNIRTPGGRMKAFVRLTRLAVSTVVCNIIRLVWAVLIPAPRFRPENIKRLLVLGSGGIGNHLMLCPVIMDIRRAFPELYIHLVVSSNACADLLTSQKGLFDDFSVMNISQMSSRRQWITVARELKRTRPDVVMAAAGTEPVRGSLIALLSGAGIRIGEQWRGRAMFYTHTVPAAATVSETRQNQNLAAFLGVKPGAAFYHLAFSPAEKAAAQQVLRQLTGTSELKIVGVHAGSGREQQWKRWPFDNFLQTAHFLVASETVRVVFFIGPDEAALRDKIVGAGSGRILVSHADTRLRAAAAMIGCCDVFLSNDSGLLHIASALGVKTVGLFGPTSVSKNWTGRDTDAFIRVENIMCSPCHYTRWWLACGQSRPCLSKIRPEDVAVKVKSMLAR